jgi:hypothetical protein
MAERTPVIYLHVGAMKTGTSYLQQLFTDNKQALLDEGLLFPGTQGWTDQVLAVRDILDLRLDNEVRERGIGAWHRLRSEMFDHTGRASVVSMEFLSFASTWQARSVIRSLKGAEVHVILTVRDSSRVIPAQWQETTQNRHTTSWPDYVDAILSTADRRSPSGRAFNRALNIPRMLEAWGSVVPPERLHVVLVPAPGARPALLWDRFASVIGVDPAVCAPPARQRNASLGYASADLMRRVNVELADLGMQAYAKTVKAYLAKQVLSGRTGEPPVSSNRALSEFAHGWNRGMTDAIAGSGANVVGEPSDLDAAPSQATTIKPPPPEQVLAAAGDAVVGLQKVIGTRSTRLRSAHQDAPSDVEPPPSAPSVDVEAWPHTADPVSTAVRDVAALARHAVDLRARLRRADGKPEGDATFDESRSIGDTMGFMSKVMRRFRYR